MDWDEQAVREAIREGCRWMEAQRLVYGTWGNVSVRSPRGLILTPSRVEYATMTVDDLVEMDLEGAVLRGNRVPTSERDIHRLILKHRPDINAVIHTHSPYACAAASAGVTLPALIEEIPQLLGGAIPCTPEYIPGGRHLELAELVVHTLGQRINAVLVRNHGPVIGGATLDEALIGCLVVEKAAMMTLTLMGGAPCCPIPQRYVDEERDRYLTKYGKE